MFITIWYCFHQRSILSFSLPYPYFFHRKFPYKAWTHTLLQNVANDFETDNPIGRAYWFGNQKVQIRILPFPTCYLLIWGAFLSILDFLFSVSSEKYNPPHLPGYHENCLKRPMNASTTLLGHTEDLPHLYGYLCTQD